MIRKIEGSAVLLDPCGRLSGSEAVKGNATGGPGAPVVGPNMLQDARRLTTYRNKHGDVPSVLAWVDLTHMRLDAGKVVEARSKEVEYIRDKRVYDKIPRNVALRNGWKIIDTRWIDITKGD